MTEEELKEKLDKLAKEVQAMEQTPTIARTLQGIEHAISCITIVEDTGLIA